MRLKYLLMCFCFLAAFTSSVHAAGVTNFPALTNAEYWQKNNPNGDTVVMTPDAIASFNKKIVAASPTVEDMKSYPATISGDSLKTKIMNYAVLEDDLYLHGNKVSENYKNILRRQTNISAIPDKVSVQYAVTVRRCNLRNLPTGEGLYYFATDKDFDALQETALDPGEPVAVLHFSDNGFFYYVQSVNYSGWISKYDIAFTDKATWLKYAAPQKFLVVKDKDLKLKTGGEMVEYQLGARIPVQNVQSDTYVLEAPVRGSNGRLMPLKLFIRKDNPAVHYGYLPYTANNLIAGAFKFYGSPYGWGGLKHSVDCSSLVYNVYRSVGVILPRNADEQEHTAGVNHKLSGLSADERNRIIAALPAGAPLYMDGHCVIYLGHSNDVPYVIHALGSYYQNGRRISTMRVVVSDLSLGRSSGVSFLNDLTTAKVFK